MVVTEKWYVSVPPDLYNAAGRHAETEAAPKCARRLEMRVLGVTVHPESHAALNDK